MRATEEAREHGELGRRIILHFVDHHVFRVGVAQAGDGHLQIEPFQRREALFAQKTHADAIDAKPRVVTYRAECALVAILQKAQREIARLLFVDGRIGLAELGKLLVERHALELFEHGRARRELLHACLKGVFQIFAHERGAVRPGGNVAVLRIHLANLVDAQEFHVAMVQFAEVVVFEFEVRDGFVNAPQGADGHALLLGGLVERHHAAREFRPRERFGIALSHVGQHILDIRAENRVRRDEKHFARVELGAILVEQVRDALQKHARFAAARDARHQKRGNVFVAHDFILLALDGGGNGFHLRGALMRKRFKQKRVLNGDGGVEIGVERVGFDVELASAREVDMDGSPVRHIACGPVALVVIGFGYRASPVNDEALVVVVGNAGGADVEFLGRLAGLELQRDFREVRLAQKQAAARQLVGGHFLLRVVRIDDAVHGAVRRVGFTRFGVAREVVRDFGKQIELIARGSGARGFHFAHEFAAHLFQLGVNLGKMRLLSGENRVVGRGAERLGVFGCGVFLHSGS